MKIGLHVGTRGAALNSVTLLTIVNKTETLAFPFGVQRSSPDRQQRRLTLSQHQVTRLVRKIVATASIS